MCFYFDPMDFEIYLRSSATAMFDRERKRRIITIFEYLEDEKRFSK